MMKPVLVIFNGIRFPFYLMEYALGQAKEHSASLHAVFLKAGEDTSAGYGFPSDWKQAETLSDSEDALENDERIIREQMKMAAGMAAKESVSCTMELLTESSLSDIVTITEQFDLVCLDAAYDDDTPSMLTNNHFTSKDLIKKTSATVKLVSAENE